MNIFARAIITRTVYNFILECQNIEPFWEDQLHYLSFRMARATLARPVTIFECHICTKTFWQDYAVTIFELLYT